MSNEVKPMQQTMDTAVSTAMEKLGAEIVIKQKFDLMEVIGGCEAKNRYEVYPGTVAEGEVALFLAEKSECVQRICCRGQRALKLMVHDGANKEAPQIMEFDKPFHCQSFPCNLFMRPSLTIKDSSGVIIGRVHDPFVCANAMCCKLDQHIFDAEDRMKYEVKGTTCQLGMCCPICFDFDFQIHDHHEGSTGEVNGYVKKNKLECMEICLKTNRFTVGFPSNAGAVEKALLLGSAFLLDLEYFEPKEDNKGGGH